MQRFRAQFKREKNYLMTNFNDQLKMWWNIPTTNPEIWYNKILPNTNSKHDKNPLIKEPNRDKIFQLLQYRRFRIIKGAKASG